MSQIIPHWHNWEEVERAEEIWKQFRAFGIKPQFSMKLEKVFTTI